LDNQFFI